jgi:hypothetical protein
VKAALLRLTRISGICFAVCGIFALLLLITNPLLRWLVPET